MTKKFDKRKALHFDNDKGLVKKQAPNYLINYDKCNFLKVATFKYNDEQRKIVLERESSFHICLKSIIKFNRETFNHDLQNEYLATGMQYKDIMGARRKSRNLCIPFNDTEVEAWKNPNKYLIHSEIVRDTNSILNNLFVDKLSYYLCLYKNSPLLLRNCVHLTYDLQKVKEKFRITKKNNLDIVMPYILKETPLDFSISESILIKGLLPYTLYRYDNNANLTAHYNRFKDGRVTFEKLGTDEFLPHEHFYKQRFSVIFPNAGSHYDAETFSYRLNLDEAQDYVNKKFNQSPNLVPNLKNEMTMDSIIENLTKIKQKTVKTLKTNLKYYEKQNSKTLYSFDVPIIE